MSLHDLATVAATFALPPGVVLLFIIAAALAAWLRRRTLSRWLWALSLVLFWLLSMPAFAHLLLDLHLARVQPLNVRDARLPPDTAVVVLGLGETSEGREYGVTQLSDEAFERMRFGALIANTRHLPVLYSGGAGVNGQVAANASDAEAQVAARVARSEWNVSLRWVEARSQTVRQSAHYSADLLRAAGVHNIVLVAHAWKMPRAVREFQAAGLAVIPAPISFPVTETSALSDWMPTSEGVRWVRNVWRERLGIGLSPLRE